MSEPLVPESARLAEASYDAIAEIYAHDMARSAPAGDIAYYRARCAGALEPVLELACGSGRIGLELARERHALVGLDRSRGMLRLAARRARELGLGERTCFLRGDLRALPFRARFDRIVCAYSALTYLAEPGAAERCFRAVRERLRPAGRFLLDVFVPRAELARPGAEALVRDYERELPDGGLLARSKVVRAEVEPGVNEIERRYLRRDASGREIWRCSTRVRIRPWEPAALLRVAAACGSGVVEACGDFVTGSLDLRTAHMLALELRREGDP